MTLSLAQTATAVCPFIRASFQGIGGTDPYLYTVDAGGAGGTIDPTTGFYTAPNEVQEDPRKAFDTVRVTDYVNATATARILVGTPLALVCEILQRELNLTDDHVYIWDQKINQPKDSTLYLAVSMPLCKPFGNVNANQVITGGLNQAQSLSMWAKVDIDAISRSTEAFLRKEEIVMALKSIYSLQQQDANNFYVSSIPTSFLNLSYVDGAAIPYRYKITVAMQYVQPKVKAAPYFDDFSDAEVTTDA